MNTANLMTHTYPNLRYLPLITLILIMCNVQVSAEETRQCDDRTDVKQCDAEKIIVTATRALPSAEGIDSEVLRSMRSSTSDTASLLKAVPGVNLQTGGGVSNLPVIQGLADDRLRVKVDGMDLICACANHMNPPLSYIDPTNVGDAAVYAGISPVSVGGDSIGSTIIVNSPGPEFADTDEILSKGEAGISYRSNGGVFSGNLVATVASKQFSLSYRGATTEADNYTAGEDFKTAGPAAIGQVRLDADEVGSSMYKSTNHSLALGYQHDNHLLELKLGLQDLPYQGWVNQRMDMIGYAELDNESQQLTGNRSHQINLSYEGLFDWGTLNGRVYREHTRHRMQFGDNKLFWYGPNNIAPAGDGFPHDPVMGMNGYAAGMPMDTEGENIGLSIKTSIKFSDDNVLRIGTEAQNYLLDDWWDPAGKGMWPMAFINLNNGQRDRLALFTEWESTLDAKWSVQFGLRYEKVDMNADEVHGYNTMPMAHYAEEAAVFNAADRDKSDSNIDLTVLARYEIAYNQGIEFGFARKNRSPNLYERYTWSTGGMVMRMINMLGDGNGYVGNLELEPETANTISANYEWWDAIQDQWELNIAPYYTYVEDYIDARRCVSANMNCGMMNQTASNAYVYLQFVNQSATIYGIDISGSHTLTESSQYGNFIASAVLSYVSGKNDTTDDNLYNMMPLNVKFAVRQYKNSWTNTLEFELVDSKTDTSTVRNELQTSGFSLLHLRSSYEWKNGTFDFGIENALDKLYYHPLGGAYMGQGKTMNATGVPWGFSVPGMGRSVYAGVNFRF